MPGNKVRQLCGCGKLTAIMGLGPDGKYRYRSNCSSCRTIARKNRKEYCEKCGGRENLEIDHIDANRSNNDLSNLQTLCKKCHQDKTIKNRDNRKYEKV